jgi:hypothetical protein
LKKFKWEDNGQWYGYVSNIAFLNNCKQLESLELLPISSNIDLSALSNLPLLKELSFRSPREDSERSFLIKDLFRSAVVLPSLQKLDLTHEIALSRFDGLENIFPNLRILVSSSQICESSYHLPKSANPRISSTRVDLYQFDENLLNSFLYVVRNFPKLEEISFNGKCISSSRKIFKPMNTRIPRLLKKVKPSLIIYYPSSCQYEPEPEKEGTRRDRE